MREIKFRAWDGKKMLHNVGFHPFIIQALWRDPDNQMKESDDGAYLISPQFTQYHLMQFTGCHDRNGKEIWEGDIVKTVLLDDELIGMVEYADQWGTFYLGITNKHGSRIALHTVFEWLYKEESDDIVAEVIGNIYEHPELLKET